MPPPLPPPTTQPEDLNFNDFLNLPVTLPSSLSHTQLGVAHSPEAQPPSATALARETLAMMPMSSLETFKGSRGDGRDLSIEVEERREASVESPMFIATPMSPIGSTMRSMEDVAVDEAQSETRNGDAVDDEPKLPTLNTGGNGKEDAIMGEVDIVNEQKGLSRLRSVIPDSEDSSEYSSPVKRFFEETFGARHGQSDTVDVGEGEDESDDSGVMVSGIAHENAEDVQYVMGTHISSKVTHATDQPPASVATKGAKLQETDDDLEQLISDASMKGHRPGVDTTPRSLTSDDEVSMIPTDCFKKDSSAMETEFSSVVADEQPESEVDNSDRLPAHRSEIQERASSGSQSKVIAPPKRASSYKPKSAEAISAGSRRSSRQKSAPSSRTDSQFVSWKDVKKDGTVLKPTATNERIDTQETKLESLPSGRRRSQRSGKSHASISPSPEGLSNNEHDDGITISKAAAASKDTVQAFAGRKQSRKASTSSKPDSLTGHEENKNMSLGKEIATLVNTAGIESEETAVRSTTKMEHPLDHIMPDVAEDQSTSSATQIVQEELTMVEDTLTAELPVFEKQSTNNPKPSRKASAKGRKASSTKKRALETADEQSATVNIQASARSKESNIIAAKSLASNPIPSLLPPAPRERSQSKDDIILAELKAMKIASIQARNASLEAEIAAKQARLLEVTSGLQHPAAEMVKRHIKLLHDYNDIRDVGQGLIGMIADNRGVRIGELYEEFGVGLKD